MRGKRGQECLLYIKKVPGDCSPGLGADGRALAAQGAHGHRDAQLVAGEVDGDGGGDDETDHDENVGRNGHGMSPDRDAQNKHSVNNIH